MNKKFKSFLLTLCVFALGFGLFAYNASTVYAATANDDVEINKEEVMASIANDLQFLDAYNNEQLDAYLKENNIKDTVLVHGIESWKNTRDELGKLNSVDGVNVVKNKDNIVVKVTASYSLRKCEVAYVYSLEGEITSMAFNPEYTFGEKMAKAGLNTLIGMGTVFCVLVFISFLISLFKYINKLATKSNTKNAPAPTSVDNAIAQIEQNEEALTDDLELIAVITAAIAASEQTSTDGLVVRSIRKVNKSKWQNA